MRKKNRIPEISIGLPTYNGDEYLEESIKSIIDQSFKNFELIISNNASDDKTDRICKKYANKDKRIHYFVQKKNIGEAPNFNFVLNKANAKYFMWATDDDLWDKNYIKILLAKLKKDKKAVLVISNFRNIYQNREFVTHKIKAFYPINRISSIKHYLLNGNLSYFYGIYLTKFLKKVGGYHHDNRPIFKLSDHLTIYKVLLNGSLIFDDRVLFHKRDTGLCFAKSEMIKKLNFNKQFRQKAWRYLHFPLYYIYDLYYSFYYLLQSDFQLSDKLKISTYILRHYLTENIGFIKKILIDILRLFRIQFLNYY